MTAMFTEILYLCIGIIMLILSIEILKDKSNPKRLTTSLFWIILAFIFIFAKVGIYFGSDFTIKPVFIGYLILVLGILSSLNLVHSQTKEKTTSEEKIVSAKKLKNNIFIPAFSIAVLTFIFTILPGTKQLGPLVALGLGSLVSLGIALAYTKAKIQEANEEGSRLLEMVGPMSILPQFLAALGAVFTTAGVGNLIAGGMGNIIPEDSRLASVIFYCLGMLVFTMIMGNGFAAFAVITTGIGLPFLIAQGADPVIVGALGLTAGFCGTLLTPMAANFNIVPASILEMQNKQFGVIKEQAVVASILWVLHVVAMYYLAF